MPRICKYFEAFRYVCWKSFGLEEKASGTLFLIQLHIEISKELYRQASLASKMRIIFKLAHCGTSSVTLQTSMKDANSGLLMANSFRSLVHVNLKTKRSEPLSHEFKQSLTEILNGCEMQMPPKLIHRNLDKKALYRCTIVVKNVEMDMNYHTTNIVYFEYALECAARAAAAGHYTRIKGDICDYCVKMASLGHTGESSDGDELVVMTCEDPSNPLLLYFSVAKEDRDISFAMLEFYDPHIESNL